MRVFPANGNPTLIYLVAGLIKYHFPESIKSVFQVYKTSSDVQKLGIVRSETKETDSTIRFLEKIINILTLHQILRLN